MSNRRIKRRTPSMTLTGMTNNRTKDTPYGLVDYDSPTGVKDLIVNYQSQHVVANQNNYNSINISFDTRIYDIKSMILRHALVFTNDINANTHLITGTLDVVSNSTNKNVLVSKQRFDFYFPVDRTTSGVKWFTNDFESNNEIISGGFGSKLPNIGKIVINLYEIDTTTNDWRPLVFTNAYPTRPTLILIFGTQKYRETK